MGSFLAMNIGLRGLQASQLGMDTTSHNIANAETDGYSRQSTLQSATTPSTLYGLSVGSGVQVTLIKRYRDAYADLQVRNQTSSLGMWSAKQEVLDQVEDIITEPSDTGLNETLSDFWDAWSELSNDPQTDSVRTNLVQEASTLCSFLNDASDQLTTLLVDQDTQLESKVKEINTMAGQIASLNKEIQEVESTGGTANDLRDQRDLLIDNLSNLTDISYTERDDGVTSVYIGGTALVYDFTANTLSAEDDGHIRWSTSASSDPDAEISSGEIGGILSARESIQTVLDQLDTMASNLISTVNAVHQTGYGLNDATATTGTGAGRDFFTGTNARDIALSADILTSADNIAAAATAGAEGDGNIASEIAALQDEAISGLGDITFSDYYISAVNQLGTETEEATDNTTNGETLLTTLTTQRASVSGVSIDEEATNLIKYQRAYEAASRVITTADEMLDKLINGTGRVGL